MSEQGRAYKLRRWARALRQTQARQISGALADSEGGRCANGVFIDDLVADGIVPAAWAMGEDCMPKAYWQYATDILGEMDVVPVWNDAWGWTFAQIADRLDAEADRIDPVVRLVESREAALALLP